jgi:hypothetical protein
MTMVITSLKEERSLQDSVRIFQEIFCKNRETTLQTTLALKEEQKQRQRETPLSPETDLF